jgi:hypothetical protein
MRLTSSVISRDIRDCSQRGILVNLLTFHVYARDSRLHYGVALQALNTRVKPRLFLAATR